MSGRLHVPYLCADTLLCVKRCIFRRMIAWVPAWTARTRFQCAHCNRPIHHAVYMLHDHAYCSERHRWAAWASVNHATEHARPPRKTPAPTRAPSL